jgi:asparagine synthase (glutamine-hydrolysing)
VCGIAGLCSWEHNQTRNNQIVQAMTAALGHRGPDASDIWTGEHAALGHTRLAIVDLTGGTQPMVVSRPGGGPVALTFSGEIYNHAELRHVLTRAGQQFHTRSDTEVVARAYLVWGQECVTRLRGMFAFAVWDTDAQRLMLARDRLGIKPLYYTRRGEETVFASELKALLTHPDITAEVDETGLGELLALVPMTSPGHAVLRGVQEVPPATVVLIEQDRETRSRYWQVTTREHHHDRPTTVWHLRELLEAIVAEQVVADVPIGALNSGGLDSATVAALAGRSMQGEPLLTFDIDHADRAAHASSSFHRSWDHPYAVDVAEHIKADLHTVTVSTADLLGAHAATLAAMDLPSLTPINASLYLLFQQISGQRRVVLSGEGADELFGGYRWHNLDAGDVHLGDWPWAKTYPPAITVLSQDTLRQVRPLRYARERYREVIEQMPADSEASGRQRRYREVVWATLQMYLPFLLRRKDRLSMASGVEVRVPYLDHRLVQYAWSIPEAMLRSRGMEKGLLREAAAGLLPDRVTWRPKSGYPASLTASYQAAIWTRARDLLADPAAPVWQLVDRSKLAAVLTIHEADLSDWNPMQLTCYVLELDTWLRTYRVSIR